MTARHTTTKAARMPMLVRSATSLMGKTPARKAEAIPAIQVTRCGVPCLSVRENHLGRRPSRLMENQTRVTPRRNVSMTVRMESTAASHLVASLQLDRQYHDFVKLSPYVVDDTEITRLLFLDADYVRRHERYIRAYRSQTEIVYGRGVVTLIGDEMWRVPKIASTASSTVSEHDLNILNLDAQEETSRILIVVEDKGTNVADAIRAIHYTRTKIHGFK